MSLLSFLGIVVGLNEIILSKFTISNMEDQPIRFFWQFYYYLLFFVIMVEVILAWKIGPGLYGVRFLP